MTKAELLNAALLLPLGERAALAAEILDSVDTPNAVSLPLPVWQREILDHELAEIEKHPEKWETWEDVKARIAGKIAEKLNQRPA